MEHKITGNLEQDIVYFKDCFGKSADFYLKTTKICDVECAIVLCDVVAGVDNAWEMLLRPLREEPRDFDNGKALMDYLTENSALAFSPKALTDLEAARYALTTGHTVLLCQGATSALMFSTQDFIQRSVSPSDSEVNVYGSKEAFSDVLRKNMGLIRRRVRTDGLIIESLEEGRYTRTEVALIYHRDLVKPGLLEAVREKLQKIDLQMVFDTSYLAPFLESAPYGLFSGVGITDRPDTLCAKICEGKVAVLADGTPYALLIPYFFPEHFQCMDDYASRPYYASFIRLLKYTAFFIAVMLPGLFVSAANFTPEIFPEQMLYKIAASEGATPMPLFLEAIFVNLLLEIVKEAGLRMPKSIGHSVSLVAALIVGDAAVQFGLIGSPIVIIAAISAICGFLVPALYQPITILRVLFILAGGILGPAGILLLLMGTLFGICGIDTFGMPYTAPLTPYAPGILRDGLLRTGWKARQKETFTISDLPEEGERDDS